eukprot:XP_011671386.1 PREDICTED: coadhesin-like [Strongylocentrotus purpuratus]
MRRRDCTDEDGRIQVGCIGKDMDEPECNTNPCPVVRNWSPWVEVQTCSKSCDTGTTMRRRDCTDEDGRIQVGCIGKDMDEPECNTNPCPVVRNWSPWVEVQTCTKSCDTGTTMRRRDCTDEDGRIQVGCIGKDMDRPECNTNPCPVVRNWSPWVEVQTCTKSCDTGTTMRRRDCTDEDGRIQVGCIGKDMDRPECNTNPCPVVRNWSPWVEVQTCTKSCDTGTTMRRRDCTDEDGRIQVGCIGKDMDRPECNTNPCPVVRNWSPWVEVQTCSKSCDTGTTMRRRDCTDEDGRIQVGCIGKDMDEPECNTNPCPVVRNWSPWVEVQTCTKSCDTGTKMRRRNCTDEDGRIQVGCIGKDMDEPECNTNPCPVERAVHWSPWTGLPFCSKTCGAGVTLRRRKCLDERGVKQVGCPGQAMDRPACNPGPCGVIKGVRRLRPFMFG